MLRNIFLFSVFTLFTITLKAQDLENSLMWKITGNGIEKPSYIYGTIHMSCDATLNKEIIQALDETSLLVLELDMDDPAMQMNMMKLMAMKDDKTIKEILSEADYTFLNDFYKKQFGVGLESMNRVKPFFLSAMIYPKLLDCPVQSLEIELMKVAHKQNEEVIGLETVEEQMSIFDDIPYEDQLADLLKSAKDSLKNDIVNFNKMMEVYNKQDIDAMVDLVIEDETLTTSKHADKLLVNRNKNWIPKIIEFAKENPTFFGVGAAHLGGQFGVINLLRKQGYTITPVKQ